MTNPRPVTMRSGVIENEVIPLMAYLKSPKKLHFVLPKGLSIFSYGSHFVLNPTHAKIPLENLCLSERIRTASLNQIYVCHLSVNAIEHT